MRALAKETMARVKECVRRHRAKRDGPAIITVEGVVVCDQCAGEGCVCCTDGVVEVLHELDREDVAP
jgi:NifB/MoaA-like Fe-S oxidoreductase